MICTVVLNGCSEDFISQAEAINGFVADHLETKPEYSVILYCDESQKAELAAHAPSPSILFIRVRHYDPEMVLSVLTEIDALKKADLYLFPGNLAGCELSVRLGYRLCGSSLVGVSKMTFMQDTPVFYKAIYSNNMLGQFSLSDKPYCISIQKGYAGVKIQQAITPKILEEIDITDKTNDAITQYEFQAATQPTGIENAQVLIVAGRALKNKEKIAYIERLAELLHAQWGVSRPVAMNAWAPMSRLVGVSGILSNPELCIAIGVSGAAAFLAGIEKSRFLISINTDEKAPIVKASDVAIIADYETVLPELIKFLEELGQNAMTDQLIFPMEDKYCQYLSDESKMMGCAESISFPVNEEQIIAIIREMKASNTPITIQGGKTGIVGGGVPLSGHIMNLQNFNQMLGFSTNNDRHILTVQAGINLTDLKKAIKKLSTERELFWPPDPTESSATVGGVAACNASGICSYLYGGSQKYIEAIKMIDAEGEIHLLRRDSSLNDTDDCTKALNTYLGSQGIFGVITELSLVLIPKPTTVWGIGFFFEEKEDVFGFVESVKQSHIDVADAQIAAVEYIDKNTIDLIQERKDSMTKLKDIPDIDSVVQAMLYLEIHGFSDEGVEAIAEQLMELAITHKSDVDKAWALSGEAEIEKLRVFRHAAAEATNLFIEKMKHQDERITKLSTDMKLEQYALPDLMNQYEEDMKAAALHGCIFGHIGGNHLHVNLLPANYEEYQKGRKLIREWTIRYAGEQTSLFTEHGIGKLKRGLFLETAPIEAIKEVTTLKKCLDPNGLWNPGNII